MRRISVAVRSNLDPQPAPSGRPCTAASLALPAGTWSPLRLKNMHLAVNLWRLFSPSKATSINVFLMPAVGPS